MSLSLYPLEDVPRIYQPDQRYKTSNKEVHESLFLDYAKFVSIDIFMGDSLNKNGHDGWDKEETYWILEHKTELISHSSLAKFHINQVMNDPGQNELIEEDESN